jgi:hypothetical protein
MVQIASLKKCIHGAPDMMNEQGSGDGGIVCACLFADWDLAPELLISGPGNTEIRRRFFTELCGVTRVAKAIALTSGARLKRDAESPICALEKDGHLQVDLLSSIDGGMR